MSNVVGYLNLGEIKGNSDDANHKEWIEVQSVSQSIIRNIDPTSKPKDALTKSQVQVGSIDMVKNADESSPELVAAVCEGRVFPEVTIELVRVSPNGNEVFYQWVLTDAYIHDYGVHSQALGGIESSEQLTLGYSEVKWTYFKKDEKGKAQGSVAAGWSKSQNKSV